MKVLTVLNGVSAPWISEQIRRYAFAEGMLTRRLGESRRSDERAILLFLDLPGLRSLQPQFFNILFMKYPIVLVPSSEREMEELRREWRGRCEVTGYPFNRQEFVRVRRAHVPEQEWESRTMVFGRLQVDRGKREVTLSGHSLALSGYDYDILQLLAENLGDVVSRESINQVLPERKRGSLRNVDTHIKNIRRNMGGADMIQCVRSVGYCIPEELLLS